MYAIIRTGGKQYRVENEDIIDVELLDAEIGAHVEFDEVLFVYDGSDVLVGEPKVPGYVVKGEVIGNAVGPKVVSLKYKPRQHQQKKWGHRQKYTRVKIIDIGGAAKPKAKASAKKTETKSSGKQAKPKASAKKTEAKDAGRQEKPKASAKKTEAKGDGKQAKPKASAKKSEAKEGGKQAKVESRIETKGKTERNSKGEEKE